MVEIFFALKFQIPWSFDFFFFKRKWVSAENNFWEQKVLLLKFEWPLDLDLDDVVQEDLVRSSTKNVT